MGIGWLQRQMASWKYHGWRKIQKIFYVDRVTNEAVLNKDKYHYWSWNTSGKDRPIELVMSWGLNHLTVTTTRKLEENGASDQDMLIASMTMWLEKIMMALSGDGCSNHVNKRLQSNHVCVSYITEKVIWEIIRRDMNQITIRNFDYQSFQ